MITNRIDRDFKFILENDHVIEDDQVYASVIPIGPSLPSVPLNSSFTSRSSEAYQRELGLTVLRLAQCVPEGLLVFFPSYQVMEGCLKVWQQSRLPGGESKPLWTLIFSNPVPSFCSSHLPANRPSQGSPDRAQIETRPAGLDGALFEADR